MRILIVSQYFWPESFRVNDLAQGLKERGHTVEVLTGMPNYPAGKLFPGYSMFSPAHETYDGILVKRVPLIPRGPRRDWRLAFNYLSFALTSCLLGPLRCRGHYDIIFVFQASPITVGLPGILLRALKRAPLLFWVQDLWPESLSATGAVKSTTILHLVRKLVDFIYRRCDLVLVSSKGFTSHVLASGIDRGHVVHFPNWAENHYQPLASPSAAVHDELPAGFRVMFAGNIGSAQSFDTILSAAERLKNHADIHWVILGEGNMRPWVVDEVKRRGLERQVHLLGSQPTDTMPGYFSAADAMLVTLRADEVFALTVPSKLQSYLACGKPVIAALNGEGARIVNQAAVGVSCPAENADELAAAVLSLYQMPPERRRAMGENARAYFEANYERGMLLDRLERWMSEFARKKTCAS
ncbi:MAG: glycosyltransferase [Betaproteobacteria bacterium]|nr:glycosyltransferase [Betaproteobacteria bacterium]